MRDSGELAHRFVRHEKCDREQREARAVPLTAARPSDEREQERERAERFGRSARSPPTAAAARARASRERRRPRAPRDHECVRSRRTYDHSSAWRIASSAASSNDALPSSVSACARLHALLRARKQERERKKHEHRDRSSIRVPDQTASDRERNELEHGSLAARAPPRIPPAPRERRWSDHPLPRTSHSPLLVRPLIVMSWMRHRVCTSCEDFEPQRVTERARQSRLKVRRARSTDRFRAC